MPELRSLLMEALNEYDYWCKRETLVPGVPLDGELELYAEEVDDSDCEILEPHRSAAAAWDDPNEEEDCEDAEWSSSQRLCERTRPKQPWLEAEQANLRQRSKPNYTCDYCGKPSRKRLRISDAYTSSLSTLVCASCYRDSEPQQSPTLSREDSRLIEKWFHNDDGLGFDDLDSLLRNNGVCLPLQIADGGLGLQLDRGRKWLAAEDADHNERNKRGAQAEQRETQKRATRNELHVNAKTARLRLEQVAASVTTRGRSRWSSPDLTRKDFRAKRFAWLPATRPSGSETPSSAATRR
jgi:hypothetical protein